MHEINLYQLSADRENIRITGPDGTVYEPQKIDWASLSHISEADQDKLFIESDQIVRAQRERERDLDLKLAKDAHSQTKKRELDIEKLKYDERHDRALKLAYGISRETWLSLLLNQKGKCAICECDAVQFKRILVVDQDFDTKKVRGLLCGLCHVALDSFKASAGRLKKALAYLERTNEQENKID